MNPSTTFRGHIRSISRKPGFTLVEILVVIVIVATLAALLLTVTQRAKLCATKVKAVSQMKSIGVAAPDSGYVQNPADFFSPLTKETPPTRKGYDPKKASTAKIWGTYAWYYPLVSKVNRTSYSEIGNIFPDKVNERVSGRLLMCESYLYSTPKFDKQYYNALLSDGSIKQVAENLDAFNKWRNGD